jgi:hypothetical protein
MPVTTDMPGSEQRATQVGNEGIALAKESQDSLRIEPSDIQRARYRRLLR